VEVGTPFNIGHVDRVGVYDAKFDEVTNVLDAGDRAIDREMFNSQVTFSAKGRVGKLTDLPVRQALTGTVDEESKTPELVIAVPAPKVFVPPMKSGIYTGYLWHPMLAGRLSWGWLKEPPADGALLMVSRGSQLQGWKEGKVISGFWKKVQVEANLFAGILSILNKARSEGVYVTLLQQVVKIFYWEPEGEGEKGRVYMAKIGLGFNIGYAMMAGVVTATSDKLDDWDGTNVDKGMFQKEFQQSYFDFSSKSTSASIKALPEQKSLPRFEENVAEEDSVNDDGVPTLDVPTESRRPVHDTEGASATPDSKGKRLSLSRRRREMRRIMRRRKRRWWWRSRWMRRRRHLREYKSQRKIWNFRDF